MNIDFSFVVPVYNSSQTLDELMQRIDAIMICMNKNYEVVLVNDCSTDNSIKVLKQLKCHYGKKIKIIDLYNNYGQQNAIMCGFQFVSGMYVVTLDDDLQNPPEEIVKMFNKIEQGFDVVIGSYEEKKDKIYKNIGSYVIRKLNHKIFQTENNLRFTSFRIIRRQIIDNIKHVRTSYPYVTGLLLESTGNVANVLVRHENRNFGKSGYSLGKLISLSFNLMINYSSLPLKIVGYFGLFVSFCSLIISSFFFFKQILTNQAPVGWTSLIVLISFYNTIILIVFFIIGEYIKRIIREVSNYKAYTIKEIID